LAKEGTMTNPDQWPTIEPFYDLASSGGAVNVLVFWSLRDETVYAHGRVEAYDTLGGLVLGLRGLLDERFEAVGDSLKLVPIEVETASISTRRAGASNTRVKVTAPSLGVSQILDDPRGGHQWNGSAFLHQTWSSTINLSREVTVLLYNPSPPHLDIFVRVQDALAGKGPKLSPP
jgi:hypothetical protein